MKEYHDIVGAEIPEDLPLLPLISAAVFPSAVASIQVRIARSLALLDNEVEENEIIATAITKKGITVAEKLEDIHNIGVAVRVISKVRIPNNTYQLVIQGLRRIKINKLTQFEPFIRAQITTLPADPPGIDEKLLLQQQEALGLFQQLTMLDNRYPREMVQIMRANAEEAGRFADLLSSYLAFGLGEKQYLVSAIDLNERYDRLIKLMTAELQKIQVAADVEKQVKVDVDRSQREYYLRQQMVAIKKALGEDGDGDTQIVELKKKIEAAGLPEHAKIVADREVKRLSEVSAMSPEYNVIHSYLDWITELPWNQASTDNVNIMEARAILEEDHYGLEKVKERILEFLAIRHRRENPHGPILCLAGPPGVGKTSLGRSIARALGRKFVRISVGGMRDEAEIRGHRRTYIGAMPGKIIQEMRNCGVNNPLFMIDEIDKMGSDFRGDPSSAMLEVLDPEQNDSFRDLYLDLPFDLSKVLFITTANLLETIPDPLRDRMEVIELSGYTVMEKIQIAKKYLIRRQMEATGLKDTEFSITEDALRAIITGYTYEAGVRNLERNIGSICRKCVVRILEGAATKIVVDPATVEALLGPAKISYDVANRQPEVGVVTGLAWTPFGGDILFIETIRMRGNGKVLVTGRLGDVMQESVEAAYSFVRSRATELGLDPVIFEQTDVHIHFPEGAIAKDGPSAGVAVTVALISLFTEQPVYHTVAMTGEVSLQGKVLPIGGLKEKSLAAFRAGIKKVLFPIGNTKDLIEIPQEVRSGLEFVPIETIDDALDQSLARIILPSTDAVIAIENLKNQRGQ
ncbi:MAG: endopeptidase La, partial [bacterium]|nr:endopeptidase La [bacterium]